MCACVRLDAQQLTRNRNLRIRIRHQSDEILNITECSETTCISHSQCEDRIVVEMSVQVSNPACRQSSQEREWIV